MRYYSVFLCDIVFFLQKYCKIRKICYNVIMYKLNYLKITNFRSFLDEQKLDFSKSNIMAIYGSNASGKSNTARALAFLKWFVINSAKAEITRIPFEPFALISNNIEPSKIEIEFISGGKKLCYTIVFTYDKIIQEQLVDLDSQKKKIIFTRKGQTLSNLSTSMRFGFTKNLLSRTRNTTLLVTKAREDNNAYANFVFDFFFNLNVITCGTPDLRNICIDLLKENPDMKKDVLQFLKNADFWIRDINVDVIDTPDDVIKALPFKDELIKNVFQKSISITTTHSVRDENEKIIGYTQFSLDGQESAGTSVMFDLSALIIDTIKHKSILYIDEFGLHLHPDICKYILNQFKKENIQLIFNTHDNSLMNDLSRDQIVFVDKKQNEASVITPLSSLSPRTTDPFEKHYRKGLYGGRPLIKEV